MKTKSLKSSYDFMRLEDFLNQEHESQHEENPPENLLLGISNNYFYFSE